MDGKVSVAVSGWEDVTDGMGRIYSVSDVETHWRLCGHRLTVEEGTKLAGVLARRRGGESTVVVGRAPAKKTGTSEEGEVVKQEAKVSMYALKSGGRVSAESVDSLVCFIESGRRKGGVVEQT